MSRRWMIAAFALLAAAPASAQEPERDRPRLFLDCGPCDRDYTRTEITYVDFVLDRAVADIHLLVTTQSTGAGGRQHTLHFIGRGPHEGRADTLVYSSSPDDTGDIVRNRLTRTIELGLAPFLVSWPVGRSMNLDFDAGDLAGQPRQASPAEDPWDFWVFRVSLRGNFFGESASSDHSYGLDLSANRVTDDWKLQFGIDGNYSEGRFEVDDSTEFTSINRSTGFNTLLVRSLGPHFSTGIDLAASSSTFGNTSLGLRAGPALEFNVFPYSESTRRQLTLLYSTGVHYSDYRKVTIFGETEEARPVHSLRLGYSTRQPWGSANLSVSGSQYLHDTSKNRLGVSGGASVRVFRGFEVSFNGSYSRIRDQLSLPAEGATQEEIFLRLRQLATSYRYFSFITVSYRFGSIFSNVVNPRFRNTGQDVFF